MFRILVSVIHTVRETLMWIFLATMAFLNISPESQGGFLHKGMHLAFETSERWHIVVSAVAAVVCVCSILLAFWRNRAAIAELAGKIWKDHKGRSE